MTSLLLSTKSNCALPTGTLRYIRSDVPENLNCDNIEGHKNMLSYFIENNLIRETKTEALLAIDNVISVKQRKVEVWENIGECFLWKMFI